MKSNALFDLIVVHTDKTSFLERALTKDEVEAAMGTWKPIFSEEVFFEPVPVLKIVGHKTED